MDTTEILAQIDKEITSLQQAKAILVGTRAGATVGRPKQVQTTGSPKRAMSPEGKAKIAAAQKARWAKFREAAKKI